VRVLLTAVRCDKGDPVVNLGRHVRLLEVGKLAACHLVVFPEMSLSGSVDPVQYPDRALALDHRIVGLLVQATRGRPAALFGIAEASADGRFLITQLLASDGELRGAYRKRHLGEGEEAFSTGASRAVLDFNGRPLGVAICAESGVDEAFDDAAGAGANVSLLCAGPGLHGRRLDDAARAEGLAWWIEKGLGDAVHHARRCGLWIAMSTQAGATADEDFPGLAALVNPAGEVVARLPDWREGELIVEVPD
jgi:predicted amidohydrolase